MLEFIRREIEIECLPADIPEHIDVDVSELMLHQGIRVRDIAGESEVEAGQRRRHDARARRSCRRPRRSRRRPTPKRRAAAAATPAEPEVIKKGKKDEEEEATERRRKKSEAGLQDRLNVVKLIVGLGNPGANTRDAAQRRVRGRRRDRAAAWHRVDLESGADRRGADRQAVRPTSR